jgi:hypothetical protein
VFVIRRQQVDTPNHCSTWHSSVLIKVCQQLKWLTAPLLRGLSYYLQFLLIPHGSSCVLHLTSFISSSLRLIPPCSIRYTCHSFASVRFSPPAAFSYCARRLAIACVPGLYWHRSWLISMPHKAPPLCAHHPADAGFYCAPQSLALAVRLRSFVPHSLRRP